MPIELIGVPKVWVVTPKTTRRVGSLPTQWKQWSPGAAHRATTEPTPGGRDPDWVGHDPLSLGGSVLGSRTIGRPSSS